MFCSKCGNQVPDNVSVCPNCGSALIKGNSAISSNSTNSANQVNDGFAQSIAGMPDNPYGTPQNQSYTGAITYIPDYLVWAILESCCCMPLSIVAIAYACIANSAKDAGNYELAQIAAARGKAFLIWGWVIGLIIWILYLGVMIIGFLEQNYN